MNDDLRRTANGNRQITTQTTTTVIGGKWNARVYVYRGMCRWMVWIRRLLIDIAE